jgi:hypothetical protein
MFLEAQQFPQPSIPSFTDYNLFQLVEIIAFQGALAVFLLIVLLFVVGLHVIVNLFRRAS